MNTIDTKQLWVSSFKLGRHIHHSERMRPIDFKGQGSKAKVTLDFIVLSDMRGDAVFFVVWFRITITV